MKKIRKRFLWLLFIAIFCLAVTSTAINVYGKKLADRFLDRMTAAQIEIKDVSFRFPLGVNLHDVNVGGSILISQVGVQFGFRSLFSKNIHLSSINLIYSKLALPEEILYKGPQGKLAAILRKITQALGDKTLFVYTMNILDGEIVFVDDQTSLEEQIKLPGIFLEMNNISLPLDERRIPFKWKSQLSHPSLLIQKQQVKGEGWFDWWNKDMKADFVVEGKTRESLIIAHVKSENNDLKVDGEVVLKELLEEMGLDKLSEITKSTDNFLSKLTVPDVDVNARFSFETKMDAFKLDVVNFSGEAETKNVEEK